MGSLTRERYPAVIEVLREPASAGTVAERFDVVRSYAAQVLKRWHEAGALDRTEVPRANGVGRARSFYRATERALEPDVIEACFTRGKKISSPPASTERAHVVHKRQGESVAAVLDRMPTDLFTFTVTAHGLTLTFEQGQRVLAFIDALRRAASDAT